MLLCTVSILRGQALKHPHLRVTPPPLPDDPINPTCRCRRQGLLLLHALKKMQISIYSADPITRFLVFLDAAAAPLRSYSYSRWQPSLAAPRSPILLYSTNSVFQIGRLPIRSVVSPDGTSCNSKLHVDFTASHDTIASIPL